MRPSYKYDAYLYPRGTFNDEYGREEVLYYVDMLLNNIDQHNTLSLGYLTSRPAKSSYFDMLSDNEYEDAIPYDEDDEQNYYMNLHEVSYEKPIVIVEPIRKKVLHPVTGDYIYYD